MVALTLERVRASARPARPAQTAELTLERARLVAAEASGLTATRLPRVRLLREDAASASPDERADFRLTPGANASLAEVLRSLSPERRRALCRSAVQAQALARALACRTPALGGVVEVCACCGYWRAVCRSCGDRHCPGCQALVSERWVEKTLARALAVRYFHVVLTLPADLRRLFSHNQGALYKLLFDAGRAAVQDTARERLPAQLGATAVLHTWNSRGQYHPHLHAIVTAGGLTEHGEFVDLEGEGESLLPLDRLRALFREHFLAGLDKLYRDGALYLPGLLRDTAQGDTAQGDTAQGDTAQGDTAAWAEFLARIKKPLWHVYAKRTLEGAEDAFRYLARYTTRVGITNSRIESFDPATGLVEYRTKHDELLVLDAAEFTRRFLLHILPKGFHRIRHWGLFASRNGKAKLPLARAALARRRGDAEGEAQAAAAEPAAAARETMHELVLRLTGIDLSRCPRCQVVLDRRPFSPHADPAVLVASLRLQHASIRGRPP